MLVIGVKLLELKKPSKQTNKELRIKIRLRGAKSISLEIQSWLQSHGFGIICHAQQKQWRTLDCS